MSFVAEYSQLPLDAWVRCSLQTQEHEFETVLAQDRLALEDFARLLSPCAGSPGALDVLSQRSQALTRQRFGKVIRLFAPLYLSNECINNCRYCGFSRDNPILRVTLSCDEVVREARALAAAGFRNILLVAGEHPKFISNRYLRDCVAALHEFVPGISLEIGPMETADYRPLVGAAASRSPECGGGRSRATRPSGGRRGGCRAGGGSASRGSPSRSS